MRPRKTEPTSGRADDPIENLSDDQRAAAECIVRNGWPPETVAASLGLDPLAVRSWVMRDPTFQAAIAKMLRDYCANEIMPLAIARLRQEIGRAYVPLGEKLKAARLIDGLTRRISRVARR